jgi:hypothetical protein
MKGQGHDVDYIVSDEMSSYDSAVITYNVNFLKMLAAANKTRQNMD